MSTSEVMTVGCPVCHPELAPSTEPIGPNHYSVKWIDDGAAAEVYLGEERIMDTTEVVLGPGGWAIRVFHHPETGTPQVCCSQNWKRYRHYSDFWTIRRVPWKQGDGTRG